MSFIRPRLMKTEEPRSSAPSTNSEVPHRTVRYFGQTYRDGRLLPVVKTGEADVRYVVFDPMTGDVVASLISPPRLAIA